jgi:ABC-2 type transport system ATP-binding protein
LQFSRGLFGLAPDREHAERLLRSLSLWDKRDDRVMTLSGGMKRRLLIAKALAHEPRLLFLDEPTAGVDVTLRRDMWALVRRLRDDGVTVILTTHYIEEAEEMADRVGVITRGELVLVERKDTLMAHLGRKQLTLTLAAPLDALPPGLTGHALVRSGDGRTLTYTVDPAAGPGAIDALLRDLGRSGVALADIDSSQRSLEDIFVDLVQGHAA